MNKKPHFSATQLDMLSRCSLQYQFRYIDGIKSPPGVALITGKATDDGVNADMTAKMNTGELLPLEHVQETAIESVKNNWAGEEPELNETERAIGEKKVLGKTVDMVSKLVTLYHNKVAPSITPTHVQRKVELEIEGFDYDLLGYIDVQEEGVVRDTKTTARTPKTNAAENSTQLDVYALAVTAIDGKQPEGVVLDFLVKTKEPHYVPIVAKKGPEDFKRLFDKMERAAAVVKSGAFYPTSPDNWACSANWCGYWQDICPHGRRSRVQG